VIKRAELEWGGFADVNDSNFISSGDVDGTLVQAVLVKGSKTKIEVPKSLKGDGNISQLLAGFDGDVLLFEGDGSGTLTLDLKATQAANENGNKTVKAVATELLATLK
jgi:hypothetical protein